MCFLVAMALGLTLARPWAPAAQEQQTPKKAEEQTQQPTAPEAPAAPAPPQPQQAEEQTQQPTAPEAPAAPAPPQPQQAEEAQQPAAPEAPAVEAPPPPPPLAAVVCNNNPAPAEPGKPKKLNPCMGNEAAIKNGQQLFWRTGCEACHGPTGGGAMPGAPKLYDDEWKFGGDDEAVFKLIKGQIPGMTMPNVFGMILNDMQIWNIIAWIRTLYKDNPDMIAW